MCGESRRGSIYDGEARYENKEGRKGSKMREENGRIKRGRFFECGAFRVTVKESGAAIVEILMCKDGREKDWCEHEILSVAEVDGLADVLTGGKQKGPILRG